MTATEAYYAADKAYCETLARVAQEARHPRTDCIPDPFSEASRAAAKVIDDYTAPLRIALQARLTAQQLDRRCMTLIEERGAAEDDPELDRVMTDWVNAVNRAEEQLDIAARALGIPTLTEPGEPQPWPRHL